jgi:hypothetical protein
MYSPYRVAAITSIVIGAGLIGVRHDATVPQVTAGYVPFLIIGLPTQHSAPGSSA